MLTGVKAVANEKLLPPETALLPTHFFRHEFGRITARLVHRFGARHLALIEDAVQAAMLRSVSAYTGPATPQKLAAWLFAVARNGLIDELRRTRFLAEDIPLETVPSEVSTTAALPGELQDDDLRLLFVCADGNLSETTQLALALKLVSGLSTGEIAARLFLSEANVQKLLERGRQRLAEVWSREDQDELLSPNNAALHSRLESVHAMLHLLFTSGHAVTSGDTLIRRELCAEAIRLAQGIVAHPYLATDATWALLAVFHFHVARLGSRAADGQVVMLYDQDRSTWDWQHIQLGFHCLSRSSEQKTRSPYHFEALILAEHCMAPSFEQTRWEEIVSSYELWEQLQPSPLLTLNRAIALAEWKGAATGLRLLESLTPPPWLVRYYLWDATLAELSRRAGRFEAAVRYGEAAAQYAPSSAERELFLSRVRRAQAGDTTR
jgi:RNA polymerase sigma factor (sigma-70 family)